MTALSSRLDKIVYEPSWGGYCDDLRSGGGDTYYNCEGLQSSLTSSHDRVHTSQASFIYLTAINPLGLHRVVLTGSSGASAVNSTGSGNQKVNCISFGHAATAPFDVESRISRLLAEVYNLVRSHRTRMAIDVLFDHCRILLASEQTISDCDRLLEKADLGLLDSTLMVAMLSVTLPVKRILKSRSQFFMQVYYIISMSRGDDRAKSLLQKYQ